MNEKLAPYTEDHFHASFFPEHQAAIYRQLENKHTSVDVSDIDPLGTEMVLNIGPQHPATHGVLRVVTKLDGEKITKCVLDIGYLHRGIEKLAEYKTFQEFMPYTDRMDYLSPYMNNVAFCLAVEKACGIEAPERAQYIRTIASELSRISGHLLWMGTMVMDAGAITMFMYTFRERENIYTIFDKLAGVRFTVSHCRIGGIQFDLTDEVAREIRSYIKGFRKHLSDWDKFLNRNKIWLDRNIGVGVVSKEDAIAYGFTGPNLRASGVAHDLRISNPYMVYDRLKFDIPTREEGDCLARYFVRLSEMSVACDIIDQCLDQMQPGIIRVDDAKKTFASKEEVYYSMEGMIHDFMMTDVGVCPPKGVETYHAIEASKGELGFHIISDGTGSPWRMKIKSPSFSNLQVLEKMMEGAGVADTVVLIGSIDPVMGEADK
jgi:NADH-quinone oxidoreductase subunit D